MNAKPKFRRTLLPAPGTIAAMRRAKGTTLAKIKAEIAASKPEDRTAMRRAYRSRGLLGGRYGNLKKGRR